MPLHRASKNDWDDVSASKRSTLQQIAASSNGILTIPNLITVAGGGLVALGLFYLIGEISRDDILKATLLITLGRLLDIADGYVAEWTKTKSPFGEALDASVDKIALLLVGGVLLFKDLLPMWVLFVMLLHSFYNSILSFTALYKERRFHPSFLGKLAVWFEWFSITAFLAIKFLANNGVAEIITMLLAWGSFAAFAVLGSYSSINYTSNFKKFTKKIN